MMNHATICSLVVLVLCTGSAARSAHRQLPGAAAAAGPAATPAWIPGVGWVSISLMDPQPGGPPVGAGGTLLPAAGTAAAPNAFNPFLVGSAATWSTGADSSNAQAPQSASTFPLHQPLVTPANQAASLATDTSSVQGPVESMIEARQPATGTAASVKSATPVNSTAGTPPRTTPSEPPQAPKPPAAAGAKAGSAAPAAVAAGNKTGSSSANQTAKGLPTLAAPGALQQGPHMLNASKAAPITPGSSLAGSSATNKAQGRPAAATNTPTPRAHGSMVAGTATAAAKSGLTGRDPFLLTQPGANQTLHIGCLLVRQQLQQGGVNLAHEAMKLSLRDNLPKFKPAFNAKLTCYETQCGHMSAVHAMQLLVEQGAEAVVSTTCSTDAVASVHIAAAAQIPLIAASASSPQLSGTPFFSRTVPSDRYGAAVDAKLALSLGLKNVGVVEEQNAFGQGVSFFFMAYLSAYGGLISEVHGFQPGKGDPQAAVTDMLKGKATGLDGVYIATNDLAFLAGFLAAADKSRLDVPIIAPGGAAASTELSVALKGNLGALKRLVTVAEGEGSREYEASLRAAVNNSTTDLDTAGTGQAYDAVTALLMAYAAAPAPKKGADVAQLVPKQRFQGVTGPVEFDEVGDLVPHNGSFVKGTFTNKGKLVLGPFLPAPK